MWIMHLKKAVVNSPVWNKRLGGKGRAAPLARDLCQRHRGLFSLAQDLDFPKLLRLAAHNAALSARPVRSPGCLLIRWFLRAFSSQCSLCQRCRGSSLKLHCRPGWWAGCTLLLSAQWFCVLNLGDVVTCWHLTSCWLRGQKDTVSGILSRTDRNRRHYLSI